MDRKKACAVVPAYKEEKRIERVLKELKKSKYLDEIIVVDDGSKDRTCEKVRAMNVRCIVNDKNYGKGFAMGRGIKNTDAEIIFFCDADLIGFTAEMADKILEPILKNGIDMCVGTFRTMKSKLCLWSGQRAIKRELWDNLPEFYKKGFRIELGLNLFANSCKIVKLKYSQEIKETKHGVFRGLYRRIFMYLQILSAIIRFLFYDFWKSGR